MAKRKPCKPKDGIDFQDWLARAEERLFYEMLADALDERTAEINYIYDLTLGNPKQAHVLCPVHIK